LNYDNACKYLAEQYPVEFATWLLSLESQDIQVLKTELTLEPIRADAVTFLQTANQILHIEFQTLPASNPPIPFRMLDYSVRLKRQYRCDVEQVVIFLQATNDEIVFTEDYQDRTTSHRYRVVRLWEQDSAPFLANPGLLPLATLTQTDSPQALLAQVAEQVDRISDREQRQNIAGCAEILAGLRFEKDLIRQFFREEIMRESVIYQDILQQGVQQGRQEGRQKEGEVALITRQLTRRLGDLDLLLIERIRGLSTLALEELGVALLDFSNAADLMAWFDQQERREGEIALITRQLTQRLGEVDPSLSDRIRRLSPLALEALGIALLDFSEVADLVAWLEQQAVRD
jgi:predicted transposase/invertase (TIGR01784 family)